MSQLNQMKKKNNVIVYRIKNLETGLYYKSREYYYDDKPDANGSRYKTRYNYDNEGRFFSSELGARKCISEITGKSFTKFSKMSTAEKILKGHVEHSNYQIVKTKITLKDIE